MKSERLEKQKGECRQMNSPTIMEDRFAGQSNRQRGEKARGKIEMQR